MIWEIISKILAITVAGGVSHLSDYLIRLIENYRIKRLARYGAGMMLVFPALLDVFFTLLDAAGIARSPEERRRIGWILAAAYFIAIVPFGVGVIIAYVLEQILTGE